jgi:hypothetical protein
MLSCATAGSGSGSGNLWYNGRPSTHFNQNKVETSSPHTKAQPLCKIGKAIFVAFRGLVTQQSYAFWFEKRDPTTD